MKRKRHPTFHAVIDDYIRDMWAQGRMRSKRTEVAYRSALVAHAEDVDNKHPIHCTRADVKRTLRRWPVPNSQRTRRAILISFYDWLMEEGHRRDNPARQTPRPRKTPTNVYRLNLAEVAAMLAAARTTRERRVIYLGICAGLRNAELRGLRGIHFQRPEFIHVSKDIAKGGRERWVPVLADLDPVVQEIRKDVADDEYVLPALRWRNPPLNTIRGTLATRPSSSQALRTMVMDVAKRAGIKAHIHPHLLRHAFGDHVARYAGIKLAQAMLGHADVKTTEAYTGAVTLDELAAAVRGMRFVPMPESPTPEVETLVLTRLTTSAPGENTVKAPTRIELVSHATRVGIGHLVARECARLAELRRYMEAATA